MKDTLTGPDRMGNRLPPGVLVILNRDLADALTAVVEAEITVDDVEPVAVLASAVQRREG